MLDRLHYRYPSLLVDDVVEYEAGRRIVAVKNVTVNEDFFQGHFPGAPLMPGVLMIETLAQAATLLLMQESGGPALRARLRGVDNAKFRRQVVPGDRLTLEVTLGRRRGAVTRAQAVASVEQNVVAEAELVMTVTEDVAAIHPTAIVHPGAAIGDGSVIGPHAIIGPDVRIGRRCSIGASSVIDGWTEIGDECEVYPMCSIGLVPQDLKFHGEKTRLKIGDRNVFREFVTIHRGTHGGGGVTTVGDHNFFMAYVHVAHDCHVGSHTIFGNAATLGGHVEVDDFATISAFSAVHQFCRIARHAFIGGASIVTKDALPFAKSVGNRARLYGLNTIGLVRRGFPPDVVAKLKRAYRLLMVSKLNTSRALHQIEHDPELQCDEVRYLLDFIRSSKRGVVLRRPTRRDEMVADD
ncbi:MAG: acyl-ACP--UDP-N-acetylglucosamine O-acyltransferase [Acidobacteria bacterium]|nr:acyl-ACP--UDP-N-acetylglucosamine O-acyltransferase [Acidobacteriota bacterium]